MVNNFEHLLPHVIFEAVETLGGRCTGRFLVLNAMENRVYDIEKEGEDNIIIKFYRPGRWDRPTIQGEHDFLKACEEGEVPVVCPFADSSGQTLFEKDGVFFAVFPKRRGRLEPELNDEQLERLGRFLARIHNVGRTFKKASRLRLDPQTYGRDGLAFLLKEELLPLGLGPRYEHIVNAICDLIDPFFKGAEFILTHGDCHAGNVLWDGNEPVFIDFDDMIFAPPVQDFWMLIGGDDAVAKENRELLIESYEQISSFNRDTLHLTEPLRALRMVYFSSWIGKRREDGAFKLAFPNFGTERFWQTQIEDLSIQLERIREGF